MKMNMGKPIILVVVLCLLFICPVSAYSQTHTSGDVTGDGKVDLQDAIVALQILVEISPSTSISLLGDINGDDRIGLEEAFYAVQEVAGLYNEPPELNPIGNKTVDENSTLTFTISASDPEADTLTYSAYDLPNGATFDADAGTFSWTPTYAQGGAYDVTFTVTDSYNNSDSETVTITVNNVLASEDWDYILDYGQGSGNLTLTEQQDGSIIVDGSWSYLYYGAFATGSFTNGSATISGASVSFTASGTATHPLVTPSAFTMYVNVTTNNGQASGTYTLTFSNPSWPSGFSGSLVATRASGSGITQ